MSNPTENYREPGDGAEEAVNPPSAAAASLVSVAFAYFIVTILLGVFESAKSFLAPFQNIFVDKFLNSY